LFSASLSLINDFLQYKDVLTNSMAPWLIEFENNNGGGFVCLLFMEG